jgi:glycosyltransferase involved in cell wall biosynthesis
MGALRNPVAITLARWLERTIYRNSAHVVALSPGMRDGVVAAGVPPERVSMIPNASDLDLFSPELDGTEFRDRLGIGDRFMCIYFGSMGEANDLTPVVEAARLLQEQGEDGLVFVLHGDGKRRPQLEAFCRQHGLTNVILSDQMPDKRDLAHLVAASNVCMTIYKNVPILYTCSPNKLFDTFAAGRPAIVNSPGWLQELVEENEAGIYVRPDDAAHLAERVVYLRDHPETVAAYGQNARRLAERRFDRKQHAAHLLSILDRVAK